MGVVEALDDRIAGSEREGVRMINLEDAYVRIKGHDVVLEHMRGKHCGTEAVDVELLDCVKDEMNNIDISTM